MNLIFGLLGKFFVFFSKFSHRGNHFWWFESYYYQLDWMNRIQKRSNYSKLSGMKMSYPKNFAIVQHWMNFFYFDYSALKVVLCAYKMMHHSVFDSLMVLEMIYFYLPSNDYFSQSFVEFWEIAMFDYIHPHQHCRIKILCFVDSHFHYSSTRKISWKIEKNHEDDHYHIYLVFEAQLYIFCLNFFFNYHIDDIKNNIKKMKKNRNEIKERNKEFFCFGNIRIIQNKQKRNDLK